MTLTAWLKTAFNCFVRLFGDEETSAAVSSIIRPKRLIVHLRISFWTCDRTLSLGLADLWSRRIDSNFSRTKSASGGVLYSLKASAYKKAARSNRVFVSRARDERYALDLSTESTNNRSSTFSAPPSKTSLSDLQASGVSEAFSAILCSTTNFVGVSKG